MFYNESRKTKLSVPKFNKPNEPLANMPNTLNAKAPRRAMVTNDDDSLIDTGSYLSTLVNKKPAEKANDLNQGDAVDGGNSEANPSTTLSSSNSLDDIASLSEPITNEPVGSSKSVKSD